MVWGDGDFHRLQRQKVALVRQLAGFEVQVVICDADTVGLAQGDADDIIQELVVSWSAIMKTHWVVFRCLLTIPI